MERSTAPFHIDRKGLHLTLDAVPAWVCIQCGEAYFEESEVDSIQDIVIHTVHELSPESRHEIVRRLEATTPTVITKPYPIPRMDVRRPMG